MQLAISIGFLMWATQWLADFLFGNVLGLVPTHPNTVDPQTAVRLPVYSQTIQGMP